MCRSSPEEEKRTHIGIQLVVRNRSDDPEILISHLLVRKVLIIREIMFARVVEMNC
jgi:hypothetical protein